MRRFWPVCIPDVGRTEEKQEELERARQKALERLREMDERLRLIDLHINVIGRE